MAGMLAAAFPSRLSDIPDSDAGQMRADVRKTCSQVRLSGRTGKVLCVRDHRRQHVPMHAPLNVGTPTHFCEKAPATASAGLVTA